MNPLVYYQKIEIIVEWQIALFVTEIILAAFLGAVNIGEMVKIKTFFYQFFLVHFGFFGFVEALQYTPVFPQDIVNVSNQIGVVAVELVVVSIAAHVGTEFFVNSSAEFFVAFEAGAFFHRGGGF